jgi:hypothetical protein
MKTRTAAQTNAHQMPGRSVLTSPNSYATLGDDALSDDEALEKADDAALGIAGKLHPPDPQAPTTPTVGWDSFIDSLDDTTKQDMRMVDTILINYANFVGDELCAFHCESTMVMARLNKLEDAMADDRDEDCGKNYHTPGGD